MENTNNNFEIKKPYKIGEPCILDPSIKCDGCNECMMCDLDENKVCDNCGKCLDTFNTDDKGFVSIKIDKIIKDSDGEESVSLESLLQQYGLDGEDE